MRVEWIFKEGDWHRGPWEIAHREEIISINRTGWAPSNFAAIPGFINLHCHLELSRVDGASLKADSFGKWVNNLRAATSSYTADDYLKSVEFGINKMVEGGVTTVVDVGNTEGNWKVQDKLPLRLIAQRELIGLDSSVAMQRFESAISELKRLQPSALFEPSLTTHAPFSTSIELINRVIEFRKGQKNPLDLNMHVAESFDEHQFFTQQDGPLWDLASSIFPELQIEGQESSARHLFKKIPSLNNQLWVHGNTLSKGDLLEIKNRNVSLVHCPRSRAYFDHPYPNLNLWDDLAVSWGVGTDSQASNEDLNFWNELKFLKMNHNLSANELLMKCTAEAAKIIGREDLGKIEEKCSADFQILDLGDFFNFKNLLTETPRLSEVYCRGRRVYKGPTN